MSTSYKCIKCRYKSDTYEDFNEITGVTSEWMCWDCFDSKHIDEVNSSLRLPGFKAARKRAVGFELEACFTHPYKWKDPGAQYIQRIYEDGSLEADNDYDEVAEICTQPLRDLRKLNKVLIAMKSAGGYVNDSCGGHIHVDARDINRKFDGGDDDFMAVLHLWRSVQAGFIALCSPERIAQNIYPFDDNAQYALANTVNSDLDLFDRYKALNISALEKNTLEFRLWDASLDYNVLHMRAELCRKFVSYCYKTMSAKGSYAITSGLEKKIYWCTSRKAVPSVDAFKNKIKEKGVAEINMMCDTISVGPVLRANLIAYHKKVWKV